ncbi:MAG: sugar O-acetyltransferase [Gammaproteobacteria bacterium]|nr:sugar O-acetyltransferase [Gammaproteobacteria bacterium]
MRPFPSRDPSLREQRARAHKFCRRYQTEPSKQNSQLVKSLFAHCGKNVIIESGFFCDYGQFITVGDNTFLNINVTCLDGGKIEIGNDCLIGPNVQILTVTHTTDAAARLNKENFVADIHIGDNVWIGAGAILLPGVTVAAGAVIGAGSVVTKSIAANQTVVGNPARPIAHSNPHG